MRQVNVVNGYQGNFGPGGAHVEDFTVEMQLNKAVLLLAQYCCEGKPFDTITVDLCTAAGELKPYMQHTLTDAVISNVQYGGILDEVAQRPQVTVSFTFGKIEWAYTHIDDKAKTSAVVRGSYDCREHAA
jgi:type VI secretion system Hcp family effector